MLNVATGFRSTADVSREAAEKRKAELDKAVAPGDFKLKDNSSRKKVPFDFGDFLKPTGSFDLARLKGLEVELREADKSGNDAWEPKEVQFQLVGGIRRNRTSRDAGVLEISVQWSWWRGGYGRLCGR